MLNVNSEQKKLNSLETILLHKFQSKITAFFSQVKINPLFQH
jgi:hypothetical protein